MKRVKNLYSVKATVLPASVMVMLSKYSQAVKEFDGVVIQLSSLNVFKHVHKSYTRSSHPAVHKCYRYLLHEVNRHLADGNMALSTESSLSEQKSRSTDGVDDRYRGLKNKPEFKENYSLTVRLSS